MPTGEEFRFEGFDQPNYTQVPNQLFDVLLPKLSESELKVLLYVVRRTFGFRKDADAISVSQMVAGITTRDGRVLDQGTGLSKSSVRRGVQGLIEKGVLLMDRVVSEEGDYETNVYRLHIRQGVVPNSTHPSLNLEPGVVPNLTPQEIAVQEKDEKDTSKFREAPRSIEKYDEARLDLLPFAEQIATEFNDQAPLPSTVTRLVNLYRASGLSFDDFADRIDQARGITKERTGAIRGRSEGLGPKPKTPYFFAVLEDLTSRESA